MRIAAVLAVAAAYGVFVDALSQDVPGHPMLRDLASADENQSHLVPALYLMADAGDACTSWGTDLACTFEEPTNSLKLGGSGCQHVPIPTDNYVSDKRKNKFDGELADPYTGQPSIEMTATKQGTTDKKSTGRQTWKDYKANALGIQQGAIAFTTPGLYDTSITASDYGASATCPGCIAIRDEFRPIFLKQCPSTGAKSLPLDHASLQEAQQAEVLYNTVTAGYENNIESEAPPAGTTCGSTLAQWQPFGATEPSDHGSCFSPEDWMENLDTLKNFDFASVVTQQNLDVGSFVWKCEKQKYLKEWYVPYACSNPAASGSSVGRELVNLRRGAQAAGRANQRAVRW